MGARRALAVVACLGIAVALVTSTAGVAAANDEIEGFDFGYSGSINDVGAGEFVALWGNATSAEWIQFATNTTVDRTRIGDEGASPPTIQTFVARTQTAEAPVSLAQEWNSEALVSAQIIDDADYHETSVYPSSVVPVDRSMIEDAHTTIFSLTPSTRVHDEAEPTRYINTDGTVRALTDFRPEEPDYTPGFEDDQVVTNVDITATRQAAPINETRLIVDGEVVDTAENTRTAALEYENISSDTEELTVESELQAEYRVEVTTTTERTYDLGRIKLSDIGSIEISDLADVENYIDPREEADEDYGRTVGIRLLDVDSNFDVFSVAVPGVQRQNIQAQGAASLGPRPIQPSGELGGDRDGKERPNFDSGGGGSTDDDDSDGSDDNGGGNSSDGSGEDDEEEDPFVDMGSVTIEYTAVKFETVENTVTVDDSVAVEVYDPEEPEVVVGNAPDGADYVQIVSEDPIAGYTVEDGINGQEERVRYGWDFYTARDTAWDNTTVSTEDGETSVRSVLSPVEVNAAPADSESITPTSAATQQPEVTYEARGELNRELIPPSVGRSTETYIHPLKAVTPHTAEIDSGVTIDGIVRGVDTRIEADEIEQVEIRPVNITVEETAEETGPVVTVTIKDRLTGEPIPGSELEGTVTAASGLREREITIDESGEGRYEMVAYGNGEIRYEPAPWGEADTPRSSARESFAISQFTEGNAFVRLIEQVIYFLIIPFLIVRRFHGVLEGWVPRIE